MKIRDVMTHTVIRIHPEETVAVAARQLAHYNIGALPVCGHDGVLQGVVTDRDLVTRCVAAGLTPEKTRIREVMTGNLVSVNPNMTTAAAAELMSRRQVRRLPVVEHGVLCGMISLGDLAGREECNPQAADALGSICSNITGL